MYEQYTSGSFKDDIFVYQQTVEHGFALFSWISAELLLPGAAIGDHFQTSTFVSLLNRGTLFVTIFHVKFCLVYNAQ